jgi:hypothetical protein
MSVDVREADLLKIAQPRFIGAGLKDTRKKRVREADG